MAITGTLATQQAEATIARGSGLGVTWDLSTLTWDSSFLWSDTGNVTATAQTAQGPGTVDAVDSIAQVQHGGGGGGVSAFRFYGRPILHLPIRAITGAVTTSETEQVAAVARVVYPPIVGVVIGIAQQSTALIGIVDNRVPVNRRRAQLLTALLKVA